MAEYIDKDATVGILEAMSRNADCECIKKRLEKAAKRVNTIPAADVVEVVRCKDCKYRDGTPGQPNILCAQMHEDDFCSYGERKEG